MPAPFDGPFSYFVRGVDKHGLTFGSPYRGSLVVLSANGQLLWRGIACKANWEVELSAIKPLFLVFGLEFVLLVVPGIGSLAMSSPQALFFNVCQSVLLIMWVYADLRRGRHTWMRGSLVRLTVLSAG